VENDNQKEVHKDAASKVWIADNSTKANNGWQVENDKQKEAHEDVASKVWIANNSSKANNGWQVQCPYLLHKDTEGGNLLQVNTGYPRWLTSLYLP